MFEPGNLQRLLDGALVTVQLTVLAALLGTIVSVVGGVAALSGPAAVRAVTRVYVEVFRGVSAVILLFWVFFTVPLLVDVRLSPMVAGVLALGLNMGAYGTEIARGAIQAVPRGQSEATVALNMTNAQRLRHVVLPQAVVLMLPSYGNLLIELLKGSALVSLITLGDVLFVAGQFRTARVADSATIFGVVLVVYFLLSLAITAAVRAAETFFGRGLDTGRGVTVRAN